MCNLAGSRSTSPQDMTPTRCYAPVHFPRVVLQRLPRTGAHALPGRRDVARSPAPIRASSVTPAVKIDRSRWDRALLLRLCFTIVLVEPGRPCVTRMPSLRLTV
jgi:hypothetical protein